MWGLLLDTAGSSILELSARAIAGAVVSLFILLLLANIFKRNEDVKQYIFVLVLAVVLLASTILFMTALVHIQDATLVLAKGVVST
jgi:hypothetical protein